MKRMKKSIRKSIKTLFFAYMKWNLMKIYYKHIEYESIEVSTFQKSLLGVVFYHFLTYFLLSKNA